MYDPLRGIERITPPAPLPKVTRQRTREEEQRRQHREAPEQHDEEQDDDGLPHVDVRA